MVWQTCSQRTLLRTTASPHRLPLDPLLLVTFSQQLSLPLFLLLSNELLRRWCLCHWVHPCVRWPSSSLLSYYSHFSQLCLVLDISLAQTLLDGQNLTFLEGERELSMPVCFGIYVFSLWLWSFDCCYVFMALIFFIVAFSRANFAAEVEMTTLFSLSPLQVFISHWKFSFGLSYILWWHSGLSGRCL